VSVLTSDIEETEIRRTVTQKALESALAKRSQVTRELDGVRDTIKTLDRDLKREREALNEIPDQGSAAYAEQHQRVVQLEQQMTEKRGSELKLNAQQISLVAAIEANKSSLQGITTQKDTAEVHVIKLETAEKTAAILGHNIDRMIKNATQETASDALDRASDKMIVTSVEMGIQAEVASMTARNDAIQRHKDLMRNLHMIRDAGDQATAREAQRYVELDESIRAGYKERGIDLDMGHLFAAAESVGTKNVKPVTNADAVTY
jgi:chromosome segregation ATPase